MAAVTAGLCAPRGGQTLQLGDSPDMRIEVPAIWKVSEKPPDARGVRAWELRPADGSNEIVLVNAFDAHGRHRHRESR